MLREHEFSFEVVSEGIVPHDDHGVLEKVDGRFLYDTGQLIISDIEHLQLHDTFFSLFFRHVSQVIKRTFDLLNLVVTGH